MYQKFGKRLLDISIVFTAALILLPILITAALLIKFFDPGPIIFKQKRVGKNSQFFYFYKFRSMPIHTGDIPSDQIKEIKLTWVGKFIRRTNIDELPQLINIMKGDMSIVGPRPSIPSQIELIELRHANGAIQCRPGLTGLAQISSFNGMTPAQKAELDGLYNQKITLTNDIRIILRTFIYLLNPPPVY